MSKQKKYNKWTPEWEKEVRRITWNKKIDHTFKKDEKELKDFEFEGDTVTADAGKTVKVNEIELLLAQVREQKKKTEAKYKEKLARSKFSGSITEIEKRIKYLKPAVEDWDNFTDWYDEALRRFREGKEGKDRNGNKFTNGYGTDQVGWTKLFKIYVEQKYYKKDASTIIDPTETYKDNLYEGTIMTKDDPASVSHTHIKYRITENEAINLITRTIKELGKIKKKEFDKYVEGSGKAKLVDGTKRPNTTFTDTNVIQWMDDIRNCADKLIDNTIKTKDHPDKGQPANGHRVEYKFGDNKLTSTQLKNFFNLMKLFGDYTWVSHKDLKTAIAEVKDDTLILLPAKTEPMKQSDLDDFTMEELGIPVDEDGKSNFYATDYGSDEPTLTNLPNEAKKKSWDSKFELPIKGGLQTWATVINSLGNSQPEDEIQQNKLISSFTKDPIDQLMTDLKTYDTMPMIDKTGGTGTKTHCYGIFSTSKTSTDYYTFIDSETRASSKTELEEIETTKASLLSETKTKIEARQKADKEYQEEATKLKGLESQVSQKITEALAEKRTELKTKWKIDDSNANDFSGDNRITHWELSDVMQLIEDIRFLAKNDNHVPTGKKNEDDAIAKAQELFEKYMSDYASVLNYFDKAGYKVGDEEFNRKRTIEDRIKVLQQEKEGAPKWDDFMSISFVHDKLVEMEEFFKLTDEETKIKNKLKEAIENQTPEQTMQDWKNIVKTYEAGLEAVFDQTKIDQWKAKKDGQAKFDNTATLKTLIEKVCVFKKDAEGKNEFDKVNEDFMKFVEGKDSKIKTLSDLFKEKEPKDIITWIHRWEWNKLDGTDTKKNERLLKFAWSKKGGEQKIDSKDKLEPSEEAKFDEYLYECAIGKIDENSLTKPVEENAPDNQETPTDKGHLAEYWPWYVGGTVLIVGALVAVFWKNIADWWNGPAEEQGKGEVEESDEEAEEV